METEVIDLGKQVFFNPALVQQSFMNLLLNQTSSNTTYIIYQKFPPLKFFIMENKVLPEIRLQKIQPEIRFQTFQNPTTNQNQHNIPFSVDFYLEDQDPKKLFELFLIFLYTGRVVYRIKEYYLPLLKLAIYFQCDILINCLINQAKSQGIQRNFFLKFLCDIFNDQSYTQTLLSNKDAKQFLEKVILENSPSLVAHTVWHNHKKQEAQVQIKIAFKQVNPQLFNIFSNALINTTPQRIIYLSQFLYFIDKYENPLTEILENIYLGTTFEFFNEEYYNIHQEWLTERCKKKLQKKIEIIQNQPFHIQHSKICDLVNKSFKTTCNHQICLNCFFEYLNYRSKFKKQNDDIPQKIRCLTRFLNKDICNCVYQDQDFLALKEYHIDEFLNQYLQQKLKI